MALWEWWMVDIFFGYFCCLYVYTVRADRFSRYKICVAKKDHPSVHPWGKLSMPTSGSILGDSGVRGEFCLLELFPTSLLRCKYYNLAGWGGRERSLDTGGCNTDEMAEAAGSNERNDEWCLQQIRNTGRRWVIQEEDESSLLNSTNKQYQWADYKARRTNSARADPPYKP